MESFEYPPLPQGSDTTRMVLLLPHENKEAEIECKLFNYTLSQNSGRQHLYEALSYVWGSDVKPKSIKLDGYMFPVTSNLHAALLNLRDAQLSRVLWIDAISINQHNNNEKSSQIPLMRTIYAQAAHVIVWLGEALEDGDKALEKIRSLGAGRDMTSQKADFACLRLLERKWFRRIWVLQEVGVARLIYIACGPVQINGHVFCEGLIKLSLPPRFLTMLGPATYLIKGAVSRPNYELGLHEYHSIGELMGMYCNYNATKPHDKVYALLGLSADPTALEPNYSLPWNTVFQNLANYIFPGCYVNTWPGTETAVVKGKGSILGHIISVREDASDYGQQTINVLLNDTGRSLLHQAKWEVEYILQACGELFQEGDMIFLMVGASKPSIIRLCKDHFTIITPAIALSQKKRGAGGEISSWMHFSTDGYFDIVLTWNIPLAKDENASRPKVPLKILDMAPEWKEDPSEALKRLDHRTWVVLESAIGIMNAQSDYSGSGHEVVTREYLYTRNRAMNCLLYQSGLSSPLIDELVNSVSEYRISVKQVIHALLQHQDTHLQTISEQAVVTAAKSRSRYGPEIMEVLQYHLPVSEQVIKAAAANEGSRGPEILKGLLQYQGDNIPVSEGVFKIAAANQGFYGPKVIKVLLQHQGENFPISQNVLKEAAANTGNDGVEIMKPLLQHQGKSPPISEDVLKIAAANKGFCGPKIMKALLQHQGDDYPVSKDVLRTAAANHGIYANEIMISLLKHQGKSRPVSEDVLKIAAANHGRYASEIMAALLQHQGQNYQVSEEVYKIAAANDGPFEAPTTRVILKHNQGIPSFHNRAANVFK